MDSPSAWTVQSNLTQTNARLAGKKIGSEKKLHQKMRRLKAQLMGMSSGKSDLPPDSIFLSDSATSIRGSTPTRMPSRRAPSTSRVRGQEGVGAGEGALASRLQVPPLTRYSPRWTPPTASTNCERRTLRSTACTPVEKPPPRRRSPSLTPTPAP